MLITDRELRRKINSLTQYPSIPTYHLLDGKGNLTEYARRFSGPVFGKEKYDGENFRMIFWPTGAVFVASRGTILTCLGDVAPNEEAGIVETVAPIARQITSKVFDQFGSDSNMTVLYGEIYGGKAQQAWRNYSDGTARIRLFDIASFALDHLTEPIEKIAAWRDNSGEQAWFTEKMLTETAEYLDLPVARTLFEMPNFDLPTSIEGMLKFMEKYEKTTDAVPLGSPAKSEGLVLTDRRRENRLKARFKSYRKVMSKREEEIALAQKEARRSAARMQNQ